VADLTAIRVALANQIAAHCTGLRTMAEARDSISPPVAIVLPGNPLATFGSTMDGAVEFNLVILMIISDAATMERSQKMLDAYLGIGSGEVTSIPNAIMADPSLGGAVHYCEPISVTNYNRIEYAGETYFGARLSCRIGAI
jgi:hypothetical protein